nr:unnamed protein product [Digitaria exilis]
MSAQQERVSKSSSSSISSSTQESEEELTIGSLITEATNTTNSGKSLGRRLSHLDSIPHTPRVNGKIPDFNNATIDHESLLERLGTYGLAEYQIEGDGNCQLKEFRKHYEGYVPMEYKVYLKKMKRSGEWGDHVTLQAAADRFAAKICLLTSFRDTCLVEIVPRDGTPTRGHNGNAVFDHSFVRFSELWLSFWCEVHYNSLYAIEVYLASCSITYSIFSDLPTRKSKKKHWLF